MAADDSSEDRKLMGLFTELEKGGLLECFAIIANIQAQANSMKPERARAFREQCLKLGNDMKADRKEYVSPSTMSVRADANSTILKQVDYPGIKLLTCANEINKALGEEEIKVPTTVEVDQYIAERDKKKGKR